MHTEGVAYIRYDNIDYSKPTFIHSFIVTPVAACTSQGVLAGGHVHFASGKKQNKLHNRKITQ